MVQKMLGYSYPKWTAIYTCIKHEAQAVIVTSIEEPEPERTFRIPGKGRVAFKAASVTRLNPIKLPKEGNKKMAKRKTKKQEEPETEVDDDLEDLEELDELDELDEEEPDVDDDDDEDIDDEDDEDEEDEEEDLTELSLKVLRQRAQAAGMPASKAKAQKGDKGKKALAKYIEAHEDEEDDDEEEETPPPKKSKSKGKKKGKGGNAPPTRELPKGKLGAQDVADAAGVDARTVRVFLRKNADTFPKDEELGRYAFNKTQVKQIVKAMKKSD